MPPPGDERYIEREPKGDPALGVGIGAVHQVVLLGVGTALHVREISDLPRHIGGRRGKIVSRHDTAGPGVADRRRLLAVPTQ